MPADGKAFCFQPGQPARHDRFRQSGRLAERRGGGGAAVFQVTPEHAGGCGVLVGLPARDGAPVIGHNPGPVGQRLFSVLVLMALITTAVTAVAITDRRARSTAVSQ
jgi:hypothetical protein